MPRRRGGRVGLMTSVEINVTSLVDVAFTLLVIFIITAPILQSGVEIQVPQAPSDPISSPEGVIVTINQQGQIFIGDAPASWAEFEPALEDAVRSRQASNVYVRGDENVPYGEVLRVLGTIKRMDIAAVGLVAEPEPAPVGG